MLLSSRLRALRALVGALLARSAAPVSRLRFRVQPWDVDLNVHLTNGRYPQLMDAGRLDLFVRSGLVGPLWRARVRPILVEQHLVFHQELPLGATFTVETQATGTHRKAIVMRQRFLRGGRVHAEATVHVVLLGARGVVSPEIAARLWADSSAALG